jgi:ABC-type multidrug transport system fused ATPase/permease subunit
MEPTFFKFIFRHSLRQQILLLFLTCISFPFLYFSLELPKLIVNDAIGSENFPKTLWKWELDQISYLMILCALFLLMVAIRFGLRYYVNVYKGQLGERMLRRLRYILFARVLRFPVPHFRRTSQGELIAMITSEVEPLGGFIGDALALPAFEGGTLLTILIFMFAQDWMLGLAAVSLYPLQMYLIPKLQRQVNQLAKQRVRAVRKLSERISESVSCVEEMHANDTSEWERAAFSQQVGVIYGIRLQIYRKKFFIKFLNNVIGQMTPFFFYSIGGYLVIKGDLTFGALVAILAAYKDLSAPWKELLGWYQDKEDTRIKYEQLSEQFKPSGMLKSELQTLPDGDIPRLTGRVIATNLSLYDEIGVRAVEGANFQFEIGEHVAIVGGSGSGADALAKLMARIFIPSMGGIRIGDTNLADLPEAVTGRRIAYVSQTVTLFSGSVGDNLFYPLKHRPLREVCYAGDAVEAHEKFVKEARESGNTDSDVDADWIDYASAGVEDAEGLTERALAVLREVDLDLDIYMLGLQGSIDPRTNPDMAAQCLKAREMLRGRFEDSAFSGLVESFDRDTYNRNMSVAENVLFGTPIGPVFDLEHIGENPYMLSVLDKVGLTRTFLSTGLQVATIMLELFQDLVPGHEFFERFSFISAEALPDYQALVRRVDPNNLDDLDPEDRALLVSLPFKLIPDRHRLGLLDGDIEASLLEARRVFAEGLPDSLRSSVAFFERDAFNPAATVQDNILFGKLVYGRQQSQRQVGALIAEVVDSLGLRRKIVEIGLEYHVGIGGGRLSSAQRQRLGIARGLLKRPDLLILDQATANLDQASQATMMERLLAEDAGMGLVWVVNHLEDARLFDRVIVMEGGRVIDQGLVDDILKSGGSRDAGAGE